MESAKKLGLNMLNFHRTIGHSNVLDYADELGLLYFENREAISILSVTLMIITSKASFILLTGMKNWCE